MSGDEKKRFLYPPNAYPLWMTRYLFTMLQRERERERERGTLEAAVSILGRESSKENLHNAR